MLLAKHRMNRATYWMCLALLAAWAVFAVFVLRSNRGVISEAIVALVCVPRVHDIGKSGWIVAGVLASYVIFVIGMAWNADADTILLSVGIVNVGLTFVLIHLGLVPGDPTANQYGDPPPSGIRLWSRAPNAISG